MGTEIKFDPISEGGMNGVFVIALAKKGTLHALSVESIEIYYEGLGSEKKCREVVYFLSDGKKYKEEELCDKIEALKLKQGSVK